MRTTGYAFLRSLAYAACLLACEPAFAANTPPTAYKARTWCPSDSNTTFSACYVDPNSSQTWTASVVSNAAHGNVTAAGTEFTYTPDPGFRGVDTFSYKVNDGLDDSGLATGLVQVREATNRAGNLVILAVNDLLYPNLSNEVERLKTDLADEGYTSKVQLFGASTSVSNLWAYLKGEYDNPNQWLTGAILIGNLPKPNTGAYNDLVYWNMSYYQQSGVVNIFNIWVSRLYADGIGFGDEVTLLKRALDANHECRKGISRLPQKAYYYNAIKGNAIWGPHLAEVWPSLVRTNENSSNGHASLARFFPARTDINCAGADAFVGGGDIFQECSHGGWSSYMDGCFSWNDLFRMIAQQRSAIITSCDSAYPGGIVNEHILTRGGGCVFAVGGTTTIYFEDFQVATKWYDGDKFRALLAQGETWGNSLLKYYIFQGNGGVARGCTMYYGDLSLPVMVTPPNEVPVVTSLTATPAMPLPGTPVNFSFATSDPDAATTNSPYVNFKHRVEWFMNGYNSGMSDPTYTNNDNDAAWTNQTHVFTNVGVYNVRAEVMDEWKARGWKELTLLVDTPPVASNDTVIVAAGNAVSIDVTTNDFDPDNGQMVALDAITVAPLRGTAVVAGSSVVYTATNRLWGGTDSFVYRIKDPYPYYATASATVTVTVVSDIYPPVVARTWAVDNSNVVWVVWSEPVEAGTGSHGAENAGNYSLNFGASVTGAVLQADGKTVKLLTTALLPGLRYILTVNNVRDCALLPNTVVTNSQVALQFATVTSTVWFDDALPAGATPSAGWNWVTSSPAPFSGTCAHQSSLTTNTLGNHNFTGATQTLFVQTNDIFFTYAYPDPAYPTEEIFFMIRYSGTYTCPYWGADLIAMPNRFRVGPMPPAGQWTCLEVPASAIGLEGKTVNGMAFSHWSGRVTFDLTGTKQTNAVPATGGVPNNWLIYYFGSTNAANGGANDDYDHDGMKNSDEYLAGTNPTNAASCLMIHAIGAESGGIGVGFDTVPGSLYSLYWRSNLTDATGWQPLWNLVGSGPAAHVTFTNKVDRGYFRLRVSP